MVYNSGGRVTVTGSTYMDHDTSEVLDQHDTYIRTDVTRERKPDKDNDNDGGVTRGGTSYSGSKGSFKFYVKDLSIHGFFRNQLANVVEWEEFRDDMVFYKWNNREIKKAAV